MIARKTRTKIKINKKFGFTFFIQKNKNRRGICVGLFLFILIIYFFSTHLMGISFIGNNKISDEKLLSSLSSYGVKIGAPVSSINTKKLKNQLMTSTPDLGWIGISLKGSRLYLEIKERREERIKREEEQLRKEQEQELQKIFDEKEKKDEEFRRSLEEARKRDEKANEIKQIRQRKKQKWYFIIIIILIVGGIIYCKLKIRF